jgi:hypothetical protein
VSRSVVVFQGQNEFEAQMARDILAAAMIPVLHLPSLSTGILGLRQTIHVAVSEEYVEDALAALEEAGLPAKAVKPTQTLIPLSASQVHRIRELYWVLVLVLLVVAVAAMLLARKS